MGGSPLQLGPFLLREVIERGGMGEVWKATHDVEQLPVAIKVLTSSRTRSHKALAAFRKEARAIASLDHPYIAQVYDYGRVPQATADASCGQLLGESPYLVMEYAQGGSLAQLKHSLSWPQIRDILATILKALAHAHARGVIHRDLKPSNILLRHGSGRLTDLLLSDFGLAHALHDTDSEDTEQDDLLIGTPSYMAPEQILNRVRDQGPWTDLYALGCLTWQLLHGRPPFGYEPTSDVLAGHMSGIFPKWEPRVSVPDGLRSWMRSLIAKNPHERFAFAAEAASELYRLDSLSGSSLDLINWDEPRERSPRQLLGAGLGLYELRPTPMVGRQTEREALWRAFREVQKSWKPNVTILSGPAGVGKSKLAEWLVHRVHAAGLARTMRANNTRDARVGDGLGEMLSRCLRCQGLGMEETQDRISRILRRWANIDETFEMLEQDAATLTSILHPEENPRVASEHALRLAEWRERRLACERLLSRYGRNLPIVIWLDDAHWGNETIGLIEEVLQKERKLPVLFVLTMTDEEFFQNRSECVALTRLLDRLDEQCLIPVEPLDPIGQSALLQRLLPLEPSLAREVERRAQGNPLFTIQLVGDWVQRGALLSSKGGWCLKPGENTPLPEDIQQLWNMRIEQLLERFPERARERADHALELAATLGREVVASEWREVCACADITIPASLLERLQEHRMAQTSSQGWFFDHEMLRESLLERAGQRGALVEHHMHCAAMLERRYHDNQPHLADRLARHLLEARQPERAIEPMMEAMHYHRVRGSFVRAREIFSAWEDVITSLGLDSIDPRMAEGYIQRARVEIAAGDLSEASDALEVACEHAQELSVEMAEVHLCQGRIARKRGSLLEMERALEQSIDLFEQTSPGSRGHGRGLMAYGALHLMRGEHRMARKRLLGAVEIFREQHASEELGRVLLLLGELAFMRDESEQGQRLVREALAHFERQSNRIALSQCHNIQGEFARRCGNHEEAEEHYRNALTILQSMGSKEAIFLHINLLFTRIEQGDYSSPARQLPGMAVQLEEQRRWAQLACLQLALASCEAAMSRSARAMALIDRASDNLARDGAMELDAAIFAELTGKLAMERGDATLARRALTIARSQREGLGQRDLAEALARTLSKL